MMRREAADEHERANGRLFREVEFALPTELTRSERLEAAREFAHFLTDRERLPYTLAIHRGRGENPHCHLVISERSNDGLERTAETWFKRYNGKAPEQGGARKCPTSSKEWLPFTRCDRDLDRHVLRGAGQRGVNAQVGLGGRQPDFGRQRKASPTASRTASG